MQTLIQTDTRERVKREPRAVSCPGCGHRQETVATTVKCGGCGNVAPLSAYAGSVSVAKHGAPRAWTIRGNID